jgi:hypothetical protein
MGESRDANDPRDQLRAMNKEARAEFEGSEQSDTGGQEHASRADRERVPARAREEGAHEAAAERATREQSDADRQRVSGGGDVASGGAQRTAGGPDEE